MYDCSNDPSARLNLSVWTRPLDFESTPDMRSWSLSLTGQWQRHSMVFIPQELEPRAVGLAARDPVYASSFVLPPDWATASRG